MFERRRKSRRLAIRGALREAEQHLLEDETVCVTLYQRLGVVNLFRVSGRSRRIIGKFTWDTEREGS